MYGDITLEKVQTRFDYELLSEEDKVTFKGFLKATINRQGDARVYPEGYWDLKLKEGDEGFLEPIMENIKDLSVIQRFEFTEEEL